MFNSCCWSARILVGALAISAFSAHADEATSLVEVRSSVMSMVQSETRIAVFEQLQRERKALGQPSMPLGATAAPVEPIVTEPKQVAETQKPTVREVVGIWGLGDNLSADVRIDGKTLRFQRGTRHPLGYGPGSGYTLVSIKTPCVTYVEKGTVRKVCVDNTNPDPVN